MMGESANLYVIAAPSGAGKTTLVRALTRRNPELRFSISYTTRDKRRSLVPDAPDSQRLRRARRQIARTRLRHHARRRLSVARRGVNHRHGTALDHREPDMAEARRRVGLDNRPAQPGPSAAEYEIPVADRRLIDLKKERRRQRPLTSRRRTRRSQRRGASQQECQRETKHSPSLRWTEFRNRGKALLWSHVRPQQPKITSLATVGRHPATPKPADCCRLGKA